MFPGKKRTKYTGGKNPTKLFAFFFFNFLQLVQQKSNLTVSSRVAVLITKWLPANLTKITDNNTGSLITFSQSATLDILDTLSSI